MELELKDIQGILVRGHGDLSAAAFLVLHIKDARRMQNWLGEWMPRINPASEKPTDSRLHVAFTYEGLERLGVTEQNAPGLRVEFIQGMATEHRSRILGDLGDSECGEWDWGGPDSPNVHLLLMVYAADAQELERVIAEIESTCEAGGLSVITRLDTALNAHGKEHFGFRDGIAQPFIKGLKKKGPAENTLPAGEFILGYPNAYEELPDTPLLSPTRDPEDLLPTSTDGRKDFGKNGSYMVFRQLRQEVSRFWQFIDHAIQQENPSASPEARIQLAAKMVGRWPSGAPLTLSPESDQPELEKANEFLYHETDREGFGCPIGAHIRKANPRDTLQNNKPEYALRISNRHRILRRGRNFGHPLAPDFDPLALLNTPDDGEPRGLHFICFNTNISRQFEFIQHSWTDNPKFEGLYHDPDPILGIKDTRDKSETHDFTIQAQPLRRKIRNMSRFVHVMGGAYFFMPGLKALQFLSQIDQTDN